MGRTSLSRSARRRQGSKVICSVWAVERAYTLRQVNSDHGNGWGIILDATNNNYYELRSSLCVNNFLFCIIFVLILIQCEIM